MKKICNILSAKKIGIMLFCICIMSFTFSMQTSAQFQVSPSQPSQQNGTSGQASSQAPEEVAESGKTSIPKTFGCEDLIGPGCSQESEQVFTTSFFYTQLVPSVIQTMLIFAAAMALIFLIYSGWQFLIAIGDDNMYSEAKKNIQWSITGLIIALLSYLIVDIIISINWT